MHTFLFLLVCRGRMIPTPDRRFTAVHRLFNFAMPRSRQPLERCDTMRARYFRYLVVVRTLSCKNKLFFVNGFAWKSNHDG